MWMVVGLASCVASPPAPAPLGPGYEVGESPLAWQRPEDRRVLGWVATALRDGIDCPMSLDEARELRAAKERRAIDGVIARIACACDVIKRHGRDQFDEACVFPERTLEVIPYSRRDDARWSTDETRVVAWQQRLADHIRAGATPATLTRAEPLAPQLARVAARVAWTGDTGSPTWRDFTKAVAAVRAELGPTTACLIAKDLEIAHAELAYHEKIDLAGKPSRAGRAILAELAEQVRPLRPNMQRCVALEADPAYQRLDAQLDAAYARLERERRISGDQAGCRYEGDPSPVCAAQREVSRLEKAVEAAAGRHGVAK
jgi:hypothetical protein